MAASGASSSPASEQAQRSHASPPPLPAYHPPPGAAITLAQQLSLGGGDLEARFWEAMHNATAGSREHARPWSIHGSLQLEGGAGGGLSTQVLVSAMSARRLRQHLLLA